MIKRPLQFAVIPAWTYDGKTPSVFTFFESVALADLEGPEPFRLSRADQVRLLGGYVFGKQKIIVKDGVLRLSHKVCFGTDFESMTVDLATLQAALANGKKLSPSRYGPRFQEAVTV